MARCVPNGLGREMGCFEISDTQALWVHNVGASHRRVMLPDINNDGFDELVVHANPTDDNIASTVYVVSGADGASILWSYALDSLQRGLAVLGDQDNDNIQDILVMVGASDRDNNMGDDAMYLLSGAIDAAQRVIWGPTVMREPFRHLGADSTSHSLCRISTEMGLMTYFANVSVRGACYGSDAGLLFSGKDGGRIWYFTDGDLWDVYGRTAAPDLNDDARPDIVVAGASAVDVGGVRPGPVAAPAPAKYGLCSRPKT